MAVPYVQQRPVSQEPNALGFCCRIRSALRVVAIVDTIYLGLSIGGSFMSIAQGNMNSILGLLIGLCGIFCAQSLYRAAKESTASGVLPYLIFKYFHTGLHALAAIVLFSYSDAFPEEYQGLFVGLAIFIAAYTVFSVLFLIMAHQGRQYFLDLERNAPAQQIVIQPGVAPASAPPPYAEKAGLEKV